MIADIRHALRALGRSPGFTAAAIVTLALGIGATTAVFSLVEATLLRSLPYDDPASLVQIHENTATGAASGRHEESWKDFEALRAGARTLSRIAGFTPASFTLTHAERPERLPGASVTSDFFPTLGVEPRGRGFAASDEAPGGARVAIVSARLAQRLFGDAGAGEARTIRIDDAPFTIVGVLPAAFHFAPVGEADVWVPLQVSEERRERGYWHWIRVVARVSPRATPAAIRAELAGIGRSRSAEDPQHHPAARFEASSLRDEIVGPVRPILAILSAAVFCVLLIACVNVANLLLGRSARRRREIAIRLSLGAGRGQLLRLLLAESLVLAGSGAALGLFVARWALAALVALIPAERRAAMPFLSELRLSGPVLLFTLAVALLSIAAFGLGPALASIHAPRLDALRAGAGSIPAGRGGRSGSRLVATEVALTLLLLSSAALLVRSTIRLLKSDPVVRPDRLLTMHVWLPRRLQKASSIGEFERHLLEELATVPGVKGVATVSRLPLGGGDTGTPTSDDGRVLSDASLRTIGGGYLAVMQIPTLAGRAFGSADVAGSPRVILVNRAFARRAFPGEEAAGRRITFPFVDGPLAIVGVTGDENVVGPEAPVRPVVYFASSQDPSPDFSLMLRTAVDPETISAAVRERIARLGADVATTGSSSFARLLDDSPAVFLRRFPAQLIGAFGLLGLALASIGVFGVSARDVARRRREIGIRMALGASPSDVARAILLDTARALAAGCAIGVAASVGAAWIARRLLFEASAGDLPTLAAVTAGLSIVALVACAVPAWRAARIDPSIALRADG